MGRRYNQSKARRRRALAAIVVGILLVAAVGYRLTVDYAGEPPGESSATLVARVIDGDTFELSNGETVRLLAVDTPERGQRYYGEATDLLERLVLGKEVRLEFADRRRDNYGRLLSYVYVQETLLVNRVLLDSGLAYLYLFKDTDAGRVETGRLLAAQRAAIEESFGLYGTSYEAEAYYVARPGSYRFHRPVCASIRNSDPATSRIFKTREEALREGLSPCRRCKP